MYLQTLTQLQGCREGASNLPTRRINSPYQEGVLIRLQQQPFFAGSQSGDNLFNSQVMITSKALPFQLYNSEGLSD